VPKKDGSSLRAFHGEVLVLYKSYWKKVWSGTVRKSDHAAAVGEAARLAMGNKKKYARVDAIQVRMEALPNIKPTDESTKETSDA
jgi:hypothetical protein